MLHQYDKLKRQQEELERKEKEIKESTDAYIFNVSKYCVLNIAINNIMCDQSIRIKLFDTLAPVACGGTVSINDGSKLINIKDKQFNQIRHDREGLILMNINESITRFTITLGPAEEFNEECTVIGEIVDSMEILKNINDCFAGADVQADGGITLTNVTIYSCGEQ
ncbi:unnamed protein product [Adineta steineri]|uniref:PPIase cyclophilin-type domain-containing protein n=1 Tax=Adineta steineri TaxID=433720 RepID=A0A818RJQ9_9BILA|nr:unnamed protein product [Adineta steineri]CAF3658298.1 unnamed protein product [Adineta steineri]